MPNANLDLVVKTEFREGRSRLSFTLQSPSGKAGFSYREIAGPQIHGRPEDYQLYLLDKIEKLGGGLDVDTSLLLGEEIERKLTKLGRELYLELFPPECDRPIGKFDARESSRSASCRTSRGSRGN